MADLEEANKLALDVLKYARNSLVVNLRFLDMAISMLKVVPGFVAGVAVDGEHIFYDPIWVLKKYMECREMPARAYLHMVLHCVFRHSFIYELSNQKAWDTACDIVVESIINELDISCVKVANEYKQNVYITQLQGEFKVLTAEKIYEMFLDKKYTDAQLDDIRAIFMMDDHKNWYNSSSINQLSVPKEQQTSNDGDNKPDEQQLKGNSNSSSYICSNKELEEEWKKVAERLKTDLETFSKERGDRAGGLMQNIAEVTREEYDYSEFLRKFAVLNEVMKVNDDEFDYIFYTYGMKMFGKMPLIEPLEYKDEKRIKEFVIAIDTSGSVQGDLVQKFVQKTYNILKQQETFLTKINIHIVQCDAIVQQDVKITNQEEFDKYIKNIKLFGFGGTDFRPVFEYVDELIENKEFVNLKGMVYFTDGYGVYPQKKPKYETAFIFIENDYCDIEVPSWAIKLILKEKEI